MCVWLWLCKHVRGQRNPFFSERKPIEYSFPTHKRHWSSLLLRAMSFEENVRRMFVFGANAVSQTCDCKEPAVLNSYTKVFVLIWLFSLHWILKRRWVINIDNSCRFNVSVPNFHQNVARSMEVYLRGKFVSMSIIRMLSNVLYFLIKITRMTTFYHDEENWGNLRFDFEWFLKFC